MFSNCQLIAYILKPSRNRALTHALAERDHNVTVLGVDIQDHNLSSTLHYIHLEGAYEEFRKDGDEHILAMSKDTPLESVDSLMAWGKVLAIKNFLKFKSLW